MTASTPPESPNRRSAARCALRHICPADLKAVAQLAVQATHGVIDLTESVHQSVRRRMGLPAGASPEHTGGLTGLVYRAVRGVAGLVGRGTDAAFAAVLPLLDDPASHPEASPQREAVLAALNGVLGDRLQAMGNPLAQAMELRAEGAPLTLTTDALQAQFPHAGSHLLLIHGLCMNDTQWCRNGHDHGAFLAPALGATPVYLRYNTGLHIADNGRELAGLLERLVTAWPVPLERITVIGHSMGGLLASNPFTAPFARLGKIRSAGITDLRHGHVQDADGQGRDRFASGADQRLPLPLPEGVRCFAAAATLTGQRSRLAERLTGDGLVPLDSALGRHHDPAFGPEVPRERQRTVFRTGHLDLLSSLVVAEQLKAWLNPV